MLTQNTDNVCLSIGEEVFVYAYTINNCYQHKVNGSGDVGDIVISQEAAKYISLISKEEVILDYNDKQLVLYTGDHTVYVTPLNFTFPVSTFKK